MLRKNVNLALASAQESTGESLSETTVATTPINTDEQRVIVMLKTLHTNHHFSTERKDFIAHLQMWSREVTGFKFKADLS